LWAVALRGRQIATCSIVTLELLYSARDAQELTIIEAEQALLRDVPVAASAQRAAIGALRDLASEGPGQHRVPLADALIAAAAQDAGVDVLHYDHHYDRLAQVLHFTSVWVAPPGALEKQTPTP
jgi:predicted nucleic acid-binding protein